MKTLQNLKSLSIGLVAIVSFASCQAPISSQSGGGNGSKLSTINMKLPGSNQFKPTSGNAAVNSYKLIVKADSESNCVNGTSINQVKSFSDNSLAQKLVRNCNYSITFSLGEQDSSGELKEYYSTKSPKRVLSSELESGQLNIGLQLSITEAGKAAYMPETLSAENLPTPTPNTQPENPSPSPSPQSGLEPLGGSVRGTIVSSNGSEVSIDSVFDTEFLVVDFSAPGCGYCVTHARSFNSSTSRQAIYSGKGKCRSITAMGSSQLSAWTSTIGKTTFVSKNSYGHKQGMNSFSSMFGLPSVSGTPTFIFVNRQGKILRKSVGADPAFDAYVDQQCK